MSAVINKEICTGCGRCVESCPVGAITIDESIKKAFVDAGKCTECGICFDRCKKNAISMNGSDIKIDRTFPDQGANPFMRGTGYGTGMKTLRMGRGQGNGIGGGRYSSLQRPDVTGQCLCPDCGMIIPHIAGMPCSDRKCPECGVSMVRF